jgi:uncharacterized Zn finger protein
MGYYSYYPPYVTVTEKRDKAAKKLAQLRKKDPNIQPVIIEGSTLAKTWWGKSWNQNLESYADYSNRIGRGRSYVRNGAVLDLKIQPGEVKALVQGSESKPYVVIIKIKPIQQNNWIKIKESCQGRLDSLPELLEGNFPKALSAIFMARGEGLFPSSDEIKLSCSCPDWASMCKHVAATLYGIGARLDENPMLFFTLRNADVHELISQAVDDHTQKLLKIAENKSARVLNDMDLEDMFGIDLDETPEIPKKNKPVTLPKPKGKRPKPRKALKTEKENPTTPAIPTAPKSKKKGKIKKKVVKSLLKKTSSAKVKVKDKTDIEIVESLIRRRAKGADVSIIMKKTGFDNRKIYGIIARLKKLGKIKSLERGLYQKI